MMKRILIIVAVLIYAIRPCFGVVVINITDDPQFKDCLKNMITLHETMALQENIVRANLTISKNLQTDITVNSKKFSDVRSDLNTHQLNMSSYLLLAEVLSPTLVSITRFVNELSDFLKIAPQNIASDPLRLLAINNIKRELTEEVNHAVSLGGAIAGMNWMRSSLSEKENMIRQLHKSVEHCRGIIYRGYYLCLTKTLKLNLSLRFDIDRQTISNSLIDQWNSNSY